ncbi:hypothetical protein [Streptacidiphilus albus]|uniref:hypothetical protein n=1 Tax=Streptacidiphilus albus TaxID=105425 RepID=UPI00068BCDB2|nr:hypothetical protein [Streptacidiphilus albus]
MPGTHFALALSEAEIAGIADAAVADLARRLAHRAFRPLGDTDAPPTTPVESNPLACLHALMHLQRAVERQVNHQAELAAQAGAGYPQLGHAYNMSRQGARQRWPGLVAHRPPPHDDGPDPG